MCRIPMAETIRALPPESAILGAQIAELEARLEEAIWWHDLNEIHDYSSGKCDNFVQIEDDAFDPCRRVKAIESQLSAARAKLAKAETSGTQTS